MLCICLFQVESINKSSWDFSAEIWNNRAVMQLEVYEIVRISRTETDQEFISATVKRGLKYHKSNNCGQRRIGH